MSGVIDGVPTPIPAERGVSADTGWRYAESSYEGPEEQALRTAFTGLVGQLGVEDALVLLPDRAKPPRNIAEYRFLPLVSTRPHRHSSATMGYSAIIPEGIETNYQRPEGPPYIDASYAIGLVYRDGLRAVAAGYVTDQAALKIIQIQCVDTVRRPLEQKYVTGLHGGFLWRDTLVSAWEEVGRQIGVRQGQIPDAAHHPWKFSGELKRFEVGYDEVAVRMGYHHVPAAQSWQKSL